MSRPSLLKTLTAFCLLTAAAGAYAVTATEAAQNRPENLFYRSQGEGWYWYADPMAEDPQPEKAEPEPAQTAAAPEPETPPVQTEAPPEPFSLKWVQTMLPRYREAAWNDPTSENVQAYFLVQRFAIDRATAFADTAQRVAAENPLLDPTADRGRSQAADALAQKIAAEKTDALLKLIAEKAGLLFFFRSDCRYCDIEAPLVGAFERSGFSIMAVSMDGKDLESRRFAHTRKDAGQAKLLGVEATPALFLMTAEDGKVTPIAQSLLSYTEIRDRIFLAALKTGLITEKDLAETKPAYESRRDLGRELPLLLKAAEAHPELLFGTGSQSDAVKALPEGTVMRVADADNFIPPAKIISLLGMSAKAAALKTNGDSDENQ